MKDHSPEEVELGTATALMLRAAHRRIPRLKRIKAGVDQGECLTDFQIDYLNRALEDVQRNSHLIDHHPEYQQAYTKVISLYHHITETALENQRKKDARG
jgi:hypothetical protein